VLVQVVVLVMTVGVRPRIRTTGGFIEGEGIMIGIGIIGGCIDYSSLRGRR
jgi:hypothetical protein